MTFFFLVRSGFGTPKLAQVGVSAIAATATIDMMSKATLAFEYIAFGQWQSWRGAGQKASAFHIHGGSTGIFCIHN